MPKQKKKQNNYCTQHVVRASEKDLPVNKSCLNKKVSRHDFMNKNLNHNQLNIH